MDRVNLWVCDSVYHHFNFSTECPFSNHLSPFQFLDLKVHFFISLLTSSGMKDPCQDFVCGGFWETFLVFILFFYQPSFLECQIFGVDFTFLLEICYLQSWYLSVVSSRDPCQDFVCDFILWDSERIFFGSAAPTIGFWCNCCLQGWIKWNANISKLTIEHPLTNLILLVLIGNFL